MYQDSNNNGELEAGDKVIGKISAADKAYNEEAHRANSADPTNDWWKSGSWKFDPATGVMSFTGGKEGYPFGRITLSDPYSFVNGNGDVYSKTLNADKYADAITGIWSLGSLDKSPGFPSVEGSWSSSSLGTGKLYYNPDHPEWGVSINNDQIALGVAMFEGGAMPNTSGTWVWSKNAGRGDIIDQNGADLGEFTITNLSSNFA